MGEVRLDSERLANLLRRIAALTSAMADIASTIQSESADNIVVLSEVAEEFAEQALADAQCLADSLSVVAPGRAA